MSLDLNASSPQLGIEVDNTDLRGSMILHISEAGTQWHPPDRALFRDQVSDSAGRRSAFLGMHRRRRWWVLPGLTAVRQLEVPFWGVWWERLGPEAKEKRAEESG